MKLDSREDLLEDIVKTMAIQSNLLKELTCSIEKLIKRLTEFEKDMYDRKEENNNDLLPVSRSEFGANPPLAHSTPRRSTLNVNNNAPSIAPSVIPCASLSSFYSQQPAVLPMNYDGKTPWHNYKTHFNAIALINGWTREAKTLYLVAHLRGTALTYYQVLEKRIQEDFESISDAFRIRFDCELQPDIAHIKLRVRFQRNGESFVEYATDLQRLTWLAFSDCSESIRDQISLQQFLYGIFDLEVQERLIYLNPSTVQEALQKATLIEANNKANKIARKNIRSSIVHVSAKCRQISDFSN